MIPEKLKIGDKIMVVAPSRSLSLLSKKNKEIAEKRFNELGLKVSFSKNILEKDDFISSSIKSRVDDLHQAFSDKKVKAIFTVIGGYNANQLLRYLDFDLIRRNPKIFCGYSDITVLQNAIYAKTGLVTYSGPHFSTLGMKKGIDYSLEYIKRCLFDKRKFKVEPSKRWSDDLWYLDQENRKFIKNKGFLPINYGNAEGTIIGGNLCTLNLLQGTEFMPSLKGAVLFLEEDDLAKDVVAMEFDRNLQSILHLPEAKKNKGNCNRKIPKSCFNGSKKDN
jgi:muramoyltetrapeptide carboxypeptidase